MLLNAASAVEIARACPWIKQVYEVSLAEVVEQKEQAACLRAIPKEWDYLITDPRVKPEAWVSGWDEDDLIETQAILQPLLSARLWSGYTLGWEGKWLDQGTIGRDTPLPYEMNARVTLPVPAAAHEFAQQYRHAGPRICVLPASGAGLAQSPTLQAWEKILAALVENLPDVRLYLTGISGYGHVSSADVDLLGARVPNVVNCFDIGMWNQFALIEQCDLFCSPHTGFAFFAQMVQTPWLAISSCPYGEYLFNRMPFYSVLPDCPDYPSGGDLETECTKRWMADQQVRCMEDANVEKRIPDLIQGAKRLLDPSFTYEQAGRLHIEKLKTLGRLHCFPYFDETS
jgi:ADP-heptose:LPS heptosyltransferase